MLLDYDMSATTTPSRTGRGIMMPTLKTEAPTAPCGWLTPPQSAHESRRPSLHSFASSVSAFSHPSTPVHGSVVGQENTWSPNYYGHNTCASTPLTDHMPHTMIGQHELCHVSAASGLPMYTPTTPSTHFDAFDFHKSQEQTCHDVWNGQNPALGGYSEHDPALRPMSFGQDHGFMTSSMGLSQYDMSSVPALGTSLATSSVAAQYEYEASTREYYSHPQVVVPSQLSPVEDHGVQEYPGYIGQDHSQDLTGSFDSMDVDLASYDSVRPPSPDGDYVSYSDSENYAMVKREGFIRSTHAASGPTGFSAVSRSLPLRSKRRSSRKSRNKGPQRVQLLENGWVEVNVEGQKALEMIQEAQANHGKLPKHVESSVSKPHECPEFNLDGKKCTARFERSEHLKRHRGKHDDERPWPCPMALCAQNSKRFQRSDNACDHYKTHLKKAHNGGVRNTRCEWPDLKRILEVVLTHKQMTKVERNVERWILDKPDGVGQRHHLAQWTY